MENPAEEIPGIIKSLCQGNAQEQEDTIRTFFLPDAEFQHPLCRVPPLSWKLEALPHHELNSRVLIMAIYRWYRLLSPKIELKIHSTTYNESAGLLFVDMTQVFAVWFIPFYRAKVDFVAALTLALEDPSVNYDRGGLRYSDVTAERRPRYLIAKQEDHYQVNAWINFLMPGIGPMLCRWGQNLSTMACVIGVLICDLFIRALFGRKQVATTPIAYKPTEKPE